jgi:hypothetical protein
LPQITRSGMALAAVAIAIVAITFLLTGGAYQHSGIAERGVFVVNKWTGATWFCNSDACRRLPDYEEQKAAREAANRAAAAAEAAAAKTAKPYVFPKGWPGYAE